MTIINIVINDEKNDYPPSYKWPMEDYVSHTYYLNFINFKIFPLKLQHDTTRQLYGMLFCDNSHLDRKNVKNELMKN
ncbi:hypothetical protein DERF_010245 [Dermatophagoides farinae]|uniref:Uncharacterized protein n=1 Tax=Dermatophagoides farinae TaxID=6954 RepID=A0A922HY10_DERFA|nr:hypothetical protein DERF_010245 [Dermatophagoides farinae]